MTPEPKGHTTGQYKTLRKNAGGYWSVQIAACVFFILLGSVGVIAGWRVGVGFTGGDAPAGDGFMSLLTAAVFAGCLVFLLKIRSGATTLERTRLAWMIRQMEQSPRRFRGKRGDLRAVGLPRKASQGQLVDEELAWLQSLDPTFPDPRRIPPA